MNDIARAVFEKYEIRKNKKQKSAFIDFVSELADTEGYGVKIEQGSFGARNIVVGDPERADVVYTAHYDTCARMPFPNLITPKNIFIYILYQIALVCIIIFLPALVLEILVGVCLSLLSVPEWMASSVLMIVFYAYLIFAMFMMIAGPANKHTANDNTSGVITLLSIMRAVPSEKRDSVAFIFFDLEEAGLIGSGAFASGHKAVKNEKLIINFDCVSDGDNMIFVLRRGAHKYKEALKAAFRSVEGISVQILTGGAIYPSDQANFKAGVGVAALKRSRLGILYMDRIHTARDTVYREENIEYLVNGALELISILKNKNLE